MRRFTFIMPVCMLVCLSTSVQADRVGQGISENNIRFSFRYLDKYVALCLALKDCAENTAQIDFLTKLSASLGEEQKRPQIGFESHLKDGFDFSQEKNRVATTWWYIGAPTYFNVDKLYSEDHGRSAGTSLQTATALLVHEMGHHLGFPDHDWLDHVGNRVARALDGRIFPNLLSPERSGITSSYIYFDNSTGPAFTQVVLSDGPNLFDVSEDVRSLEWCGNSMKLVGLALWNFMWLDVNSNAPSLIGFAKPYCAMNGAIFSPRGFGVHVNVHLAWTALQTWVIDPKSVSVRAATCATDPILCGSAWGQSDAIREKTFGSHSSLTQHSSPTQYTEENL